MIGKDKIKRLTKAEILSQFKPNPKCKDCVGLGTINRIEPDRPGVVKWDFCMCVKKAVQKAEIFIQLKEDDKCQENLKSSASETPPPTPK